MAWTTPKDWVDGECPTASKLNEQVRDNAQYLYDNKMGFAASSSLPSRSAGTLYTNSTGKPIYCVVTIKNADSAVATATVAGTVQSYVKRLDAIEAYMPLSFIVAPGETYQVDITGTGSVYLWSETTIG